MNPTKLLAGLHELAEQELWDTLGAEMRGERRLYLMLRIYGRASKLRELRERKELAAKAAE